MKAKQKGPAQPAPELTMGRIVRTEVGGEGEVPAIVVRVQSETVVDLLAFTTAGPVVRLGAVHRDRPGVTEEDLTWWWPKGSRP